jgi:hypothetical protein
MIFSITDLFKRVTESKINKKQLDIQLDLSALTLCLAVYLFIFHRNITPVELAYRFSNIYSYVLLIFLYVILYKVNYATMVIRTRLSHLYILLIIFTTLIILNRNRINNNLIGDQISHYTTANSFANTLLENLKRFIPNFGILELGISLTTLNFIIVIFIISLYFIFVRRKNITLLLIFPILVFLRNLNFSEIYDPHPPLRNLVGIIAGSVFGVPELKYRVVHLIVYSTFIMVLSLVLFKKKGILAAILFSFCLILNPLLSNSATQYEFSIWSFFVVFIFLYLVFLWEEVNHFKLLYFTSFLFSIGSLIRPWLSVFFLLTLIIILLKSFRQDSLSKTYFLNTFYAISPWSISVLFTIRNLVSGTPAKYIQGEFLCLSQSANLFDRLWLAISSQFFLNNILFHFNFMIIFLSVIAYIYILITNKKVFLFVTLVLILAFVSFFSIRPVIWATPRYLVEYLLPVLFFILFYVILKLNNRRLIYSILITILALQIIQSPGHNSRQVFNFENNMCYIDFVYSKFDEI